MRYVLKDLLIDTDARTVHRNNTALKLPDLSFDVFVKVIETSPEPVSTVEFSQTVWRAEHVSDETIAQRITLLRKALGDNPKSPTYIRTVRGLGYATSGLVESAENRLQANGTASPTRRNTIAVAAGLVAITLVAALVSNDWMPSSAPVVAPPEAHQKSAVSILVERARQQLGLHQAKETDRAITMLRDALAQDPESFEARLTLSFALSTKATKFGGEESEEKEAEALARALINEQENSSNAWSALAYSLGSQGRMDESLAAYQYSYQLNPQNTPAISSAAHTLLLQGNLHQALSLEFQAKQTGGTSRYAEIQIAQVLEFIGHPAAPNWFAKALSLNPSQVVILGEVARSHLRHGNPYAALEMLAQAEGDDQFAPQILQLQARASIVLGNIDEARTLLKAAGTYGYYDISALNAASGDLTQAEELYLQAKLAAIESDSSADTRIHLAEVTAARGQEAEALRPLAQAVNLGWRDLNWLKRSPFLGSLMASTEGQQIESRIMRELEAQRRLIEATEELSQMIEG